MPAAAMANSSSSSSSGVTIVGEFTVRPTTNPLSEEHIHLTPFDLHFLLIGPIQKGLLFHKPTTSSTAAIVDHLKTSLAHTLDFFPPLAGRLLPALHEDGATSFSIHSTAGDGVLFLHAAAPSFSLSHILNPTTPPVVRSFFPLTSSLNLEATSNPLLAVQFTDLADAFFIGLTLNHCVGDGSSFWHFFNSWSEISRGASSPTRLPVFSRAPLFPSARLHRVLLPAIDAIPKPGLEHAVSLKDRIFHFGRESIAALKEKAGAGNEGVRISSLQALVGHLWRAVLRGRGAEGGSYSTYKLAVGARRRCRPELAEEYFGSATVVGKVTARVEEVVGGGMGAGARLLNGLVEGQGWEEVMGFVEKWEGGRTVMLRMDDICGGSLLTGSSPRFDVYGNDFGWGRPAAVRSGGANKVDGKMSVYAGVEGGSIDVEASLLAETLEAMERDAEFMAAVSPPES